MGPSEVKAWIVGASMVGEGKVSGGEEKEGRAQDPPVHCLVRFSRASFSDSTCWRWIGSVIRERRLVYVSRAWGRRPVCCWILAKS